MVRPGWLGTSSHSSASTLQHPRFFGSGPKSPKPRRPRNAPLAPVAPLVRERPPVTPDQLLPKNGSHFHARLPNMLADGWREFGSFLALFVQLTCHRHANNDGVCSVCPQSMRPHATTIMQGVIQESRPRSELHQPLLKKQKFFFHTNNYHAMWFGNFRVPRLWGAFPLIDPSWLAIHASSSPIFAPPFASCNKTFSYLTRSV